MFSSDEIHILRCLLNRTADKQAQPLPKDQLERLRDMVPALKGLAVLNLAIHYPRLSEWEGTGKASRGSKFTDDMFFRGPGPKIGAVYDDNAADLSAGMKPIDKKAAREAQAIDNLWELDEQARVIIRRRVWNNPQCAPLRPRKRAISSASHFDHAQAGVNGSDPILKAHRNQRAALRRAMDRLNQHVQKRLRGEPSEYRGKKEICTAEDRKRREKLPLTRAQRVLFEQARVSGASADELALLARVMQSSAA